MIDRYKLLFFCGIVAFLLLSILMPNGMFTAKSDGFRWQVLSSFRGLDILSNLHVLRKIVVYPFVWLELHSMPLILQSLVMVLYVFPICCIKTNRSLKFLSIAFLFFPMIVSYRTVLVNISIYILLCSVLFPNKKFFLWYALLLSLLSSGVMLIFLSFIITFHTQIMKNNVGLGKTIIIFLVLCVLLMGPVVHKLLFFYDPIKYGSAADTSFSAVANVDVITIVSNIYQRGVFYESFESKNVRFYLLLFNLFCVLSLVLFSKYKKIFMLVALEYVVFLFFEGLGALSFTVFIVNYFSAFWLNSFKSLFKNIRGLFKNKDGFELYLCSKK